MFKFFFKIFFASFLALSVSTIIYAIIMEDYFAKSEAYDYKNMSKPVYFLLKKELLDSPTLDEQAVLTKYTKELPLDISIIAKNQLSDELAQKISAEEIYVNVEYLGFSDDIVMIYFNWPDDKVIAMKLREDYNDHYDWLGWVMLVSVFMSLAAILFLISLSITRHTYRLAKVSKALGDGNFEMRANEKAPSPLNHMAKSLNNMSTQLKVLIQEQDTMTMAASHELKTPINNLRFALDMTRNIHNMDEMRNHVQAMDEDLDTLQELTHELITFSQLRKATKLAPEDIQIEAMCQPIIERLGRLTPALTITLEAPTNLTVYGDKKLIKRCINNLITNAQKYADSQILVKISIKASNVWIQVHDDGIGIPPEDLKMIFVPFYRVDNSRSRISGGHGLGLSIVERIVLNHGGSVNAGVSQLNGALVEFSLPTR